MFSYIGDVAICVSRFSPMKLKVFFLPRFRAVKEAYFLAVKYFIHSSFVA